MRYAADFNQILGMDTAMIVYTTAYPSSWSVFRRHKDTILILLLCLFCIPALGRDLIVDGLPLDRRVMAAVSIPLIALWSLVVVVWILRTLRRHRRRVLLVATARTLVRHEQGRRAVFIKREDCEALGNPGDVLLLRDSRRITLGPDTLDRESGVPFVSQLYNLWWPGLTPEHLSRELNATIPTRWLFALVALVAILLAVILGAIWAHHNRGPAAFVAILVPGILSVLIASVFVHVRLMKTFRQHDFPLPPEEPR